MPNGLADLSSGNVENNNGLGPGIPDSIGGAMNLPSSQSARDESFTNENPNMNIGGLQGNSGFGDENGHGSDDGASMNFQRSLFPNNPFVEANHYFYDVEKNNLDDSTERDVKSTILRDEDDTDDSDYHVRVHKDEIPRPENFGY
ncbi:nematoblast specific protein [Hydra vulgaris]|uniref:Nematoblast specific protein n=1 Tax=Hydra vulgaris TaxID=6087 RepID=A7LH35_HYDVU|nr:nematoblast specific protein [Hydra vulgaris]ABS57276.1 nematoblast specific protein [Hydra vulgaris]